MRRSFFDEYFEKRPEIFPLSYGIYDISFKVGDKKKGIRLESENESDLRKQFNEYTVSKGWGKLDPESIEPVVQTGWISPDGKFMPNYTDNVLRDGVPMNAYGNGWIFVRYNGKDWHTGKDQISFFGLGKNGLLSLKQYECLLKIYETLDDEHGINYCLKMMPRDERDMEE